MSSPELRIEYVDLDALKPHPENPRIHPESALAKLEMSIKEFGWTQPIVATKDGVILAGHARSEAARRMGLKKVPVLYIDLEGEKADAYLIADNRVQDETKWDYPKLQKLMVSFKTIELSLTAFDDYEIGPLLEAKWSPETKTDLPTHDALEVFKATHDQAEIIKQAIKNVRDASEADISDGRALELICADFMA